MGQRQSTLSASTQAVTPEPVAPAQTNAAEDDDGKSAPQSSQAWGTPPAAGAGESAARSAVSVQATVEMKEAATFSNQPPAPRVLPPPRGRFSGAQRPGALHVRRTSQSVSPKKRKRRIAPKPLSAASPVLRPRPAPTYDNEVRSRAAVSPRGPLQKRSSIRYIFASSGRDRAMHRDPLAVVHRRRSIVGELPSGDLPPGPTTPIDVQPRPGDGGDVKQSTSLPRERASSGSSTRLRAPPPLDLDAPPLVPSGGQALSTERSTSDGGEGEGGDTAASIPRRMPERVGADGNLAVNFRDVMRAGRTGDIILFQSSNCINTFFRRVLCMRFNHVAILVRFDGEPLGLCETLGGTGVTTFRFEDFFVHSWYKQYSRVALRRIEFSGGPSRRVEFEKGVREFLEGAQTLPYRWSPFMLCPSCLPGAGQDTEAHKTNFFCSELVAAALKAGRALPVEANSVGFGPKSFQMGGRVGRSGIEELMKKCDARLCEETTIVFPRVVRPPSN